MNPLKRIALRTLSKLYINMKKYYLLHRKVLNVVNPHLKSLDNVLDNKITVDGKEIPVRVFYPKEYSSTKYLVFFHGGGWVTGSIETYTNTCANMANNTGHIVISVDYSLAPENPFPVGLMDCYNATKELFTNPSILNCSQYDITLIGDSAGGNLAAAVSLMAREKGEFLPKKQILIYPSTYHDHSENAPFNSLKENGSDFILTLERMQDYMDLYVPNREDRENPYVAPLLAKDLSNQPDTLIITAEYDPLRDEGEAYGYALESFGNKVQIERIDDALHGFLVLPINSEPILKSYKVINSFLNGNLNKGGEF